MLPWSSAIRPPSLTQHCPAANWKHSYSSRSISSAASSIRMRIPTSHLSRSTARNLVGTVDGISSFGCGVSVPEHSGQPLSRRHSLFFINSPEKKDHFVVFIGRNALNRLADSNDLFSQFLH